MKEFTNLYKLEKTLKFGLEPVLLEDQTLDDFWNTYLNGPEKDELHKLYMHDEERNENYPIMKAMLDHFHKKFITSALEKFEVGEKGVTWDALARAYHEDKQSKEYQKLQEEMRAKIQKTFTEHEWWSYLSSYSKLIGQLMPNLVKNDDDFVESIKEIHSDMELSQGKMLDAVKTFDNFSVYFKKYEKNRKNMYSKEAQNTSIANRIVNENFPKFLDNITVYHRLKETCPDELKEIENNLEETLKGLSFDDIFVPSYYNKCLTQEGIEMFNWLLGGNPNEGVFGINSVGNHYLQHHSESDLKLRNLQMSPLYKQILSDRVRLAFLPDQFESDDDLMKSVTDFLNDSENLFTRVHEIMNILKDDSTDLTRIYVQGSNLTTLSNILYGDRCILGERLRRTQVTSNTKKAQRELDKEIEKWLEGKCFSLAEIQEVENILMEQSAHPLSLMELLTKLTVWKYNPANYEWTKVSLFKQCNDVYVTEFNVIVEKCKEGLSIRNEEMKVVLKSVLDTYMELFHIVELLRLGNKSGYLEKDDFYQPYEQLFDSDDTVSISHIVPLYMKVQSYLTRKLADTGKMLLKFDSPTLADGWDANQEGANNATILLKNEKYYLLIVNPNNKPDLSEGLCECGDYQKIEYHQIADASKDIPNLMVEDGITVRKTGRKDSDGVNRRLEEEKDRLLPDEINRIRKCGSFLKSSGNFNKKESQTFLSYYMQRIIEYKKGEIDFHFKKPSEYECYQDFIEDVSQQRYSLSLVPFSGKVVETWLRNKNAFLFEIYSKDFSVKSNGTANLQTLYWKELFSEFNLKNAIFKLNGKAELFFRKKIDVEAYVHKKGSVLVNKTFSDGTPIEGVLYKKLLRHFNGLDVDLTDKEVQILPKVRTKKVKFDIVKDKRYHEHKFFLHVPITINFKATSMSQKLFNERTLDILRKNKEELNIIGIDRGERNLIYVTVINQKGENLITPRHFNLIETETYGGIQRKYDYLTKLKQTEKNRKEARRNWTTIERIKDLKSGYMSQVVHEIAKMIVQYKAIVVLEDLNFGFKRGRFNVERQVYQKFEEMLIKKLNYLVFKKDSPSQEYGKVRSGLQLTAPFTSFKELGKQTGWLFYVPAGYTSKIDPATGFVNLFNMNRPADSLRCFFAAFKDISYKNGLFYFTFDYSNEVFNKVKTDYTNSWTLSSHGDRIVGKEKKIINLSDEFKKFFENAKILLENVSVQSVCSLEDGQLQEFWGLFKLLLKMRNSNDEADFIISPVAGGQPFVTAPNNPMKISDADANGAYNIALKGLYWVMNDFPMDGEYLKYINDTEWFKFVQTKPYLND